MKAIIWTKYGSPEVLQLQEKKKPVPKANEVLIKVFATSVTAGDCEMRNLQFPLYLSILMRLFVGVKKPTSVTIIGQELAGEIEAVGKDVTRFTIGDQVFGSAGFSTGTYAEYVVVPAHQLVRIPAGFDPQIAAAAGLVYHTAWHSLVTRAQIRPGESVLVVGASGGVNTASIQIAKLAGATVYVAGSTPEKLALAESLGADVLIDSSVEEDWSKKIYKQTARRGVDVVVDNVGKSDVRTVVGDTPDNARQAMDGGFYQ